MSLNMNAGARPAQHMQSSTDRGNWFQTYTGIAFYHQDPRPAEICFEDIAHALARECRFNGHVHRFYSVAQHCVHVSRLVPQEFALQGLLHDATEAYVGDMVRPLKAALPEYRAIEQRIWNAIANKFGVPVVMAPEVKHADLVALATERRDLMGPRPMPWDVDKPMIQPDGLTIVPLNPASAELDFRERFLALSNFKTEAA